jgi:hypothetical protein
VSFSSNGNDYNGILAYSLIFDKLELSISLTETVVKLDIELNFP